MFARTFFYQFRSRSSLWAQADRAFAGGHSAEAERLWVELARGPHRSANSFLYAALAKARLGDVDGAINVLEHGARTYPSATDLLLQYCELSAGAGQIGRAVKFLGSGDSAVGSGKLFAIDAIGSTTKLAAIEYCLREGLPGLALEHATLLQVGADAPLLWRLADVLLQYSRTSEAQQIYLRLSRAKPEDSSSYMYSGLAAQRLGEQDQAEDLLEEGLLKFGRENPLLDIYCRVCVEGGHIERALRTISSGDLEKDCERLFGLADSTAFVDLVATCLDRGLTELARRKWLPLLDEASDPVALWRLADALAFRKFIADSCLIYERLAQRPMDTPADCEYVARSLIRLGRFGEGLKVLEASIERFGASDKLWGIYLEICVQLDEFERYGRLASSIGLPVDPAEDWREFYSSCIDAGRLEEYVISLNLLRHRIGEDKVSALTSSFLATVANNAPPAEREKQLLLYSRFFDNPEDFTASLCETLRTRLQGHSSAQANHRISMINSLTPPSVPLYSVNGEKLVDDFVDACRELRSTAVELQEPLADMSADWAPWQSLFCSVSPRKQKGAMVAFQDVVLATWPKLNFVGPHARVPKPAGRIRIGFMALDSMPMMSGLMAHLDRSRFETFFLRPGDASESSTGRDWIGRAESVVQFSDTSSFEAINCIAKLKLDVIVSGPSMGSCLFPLMARLASLQMVLLEPNWTDGFAASDYYVSWQPAEPDVPSDFYTTSTALLAHPPYWIEKHAEGSARQQIDKDRLRIRTELLNVAPDARVYLCANTPPKIHPEMDDTLNELLDRDPEGIVVLLRGDFPAARSLKVRLAKRLGEKYRRVVFVPSLKKADAHALLQAADCCLDSFPICGMSSSFDGAMLGVPIVTMPSDTPFGRWTAAIYEYIGVTGLIAKDRRQYIDLAMRLATDRGWHEKLSAEIKARAGRFVESEASANEFQDFILKAWERKVNGLPPVNWVAGGWQAAGTSDVAA